LLARGLEDRLEPDRPTFLDMDWKLVASELDRRREKRRSGPHAENILRDVGAVAARPH
jgi:pyruvate ferredoxin oxidoreductase alpha subunit